MSLIQWQHWQHWGLIVNELLKTHTIVCISVDISDSGGGGVGGGSNGNWFSLAISMCQRLCVYMCEWIASVIMYAKSEVM